ncbi:hypothetical protein ACFVZ3_09055 [Kitasatospora purpeofusca]|uniref:hypothetical protein n=1 Tax=Kitasatospora purpeofusca TaxID=67352 RepID=UPI0036A12EA3
MPSPWDRTDLSARTKHRWHVEGWENGRWAGIASPSDTLLEALQKQNDIVARVPHLSTQIIRETTTYHHDSAVIAEDPPQ